MKKLSKKEKAMIECYASKYASVDNWQYLRDNAINDDDYQKKDTIFRKERSALWGMDDILECLNIRFQCEKLDFETIVLNAFYAESYYKLYNVTLTFSSNDGWKITD